jgi:integration host factor subunit alpha
LNIKYLVAGARFMALTKTIIVEKIQNDLNLSRTSTYDLMEDFLEIIKETIESGEDIMISGFGKFCVNEKKARKGRNPATDESMTLPARRVVTFKCSGKLRDKINS